VTALNYKLCKLYGIQSKKFLLKLLGIKNLKFFTVSNLKANVRPYIENNEGHLRIIEVPSPRLKNIQNKILAKLKNLDFPEYVFSGIKGKSFIDNAKYHSGLNYIFKIDISKFFPSTSRNKVYYFFKNKLNMSPDAAGLIADLTTVNINYYKNKKNYVDILNFLTTNNITQFNHLMTGAPTSVLLSYLANIDMFDKIAFLCQSVGAKLTVYVDDIVISSKNNISDAFQNKICQTIKAYGYNISIKKLRYYKLDQRKTITGVIINECGAIKTPNALTYKIHSHILQYKKKTINEKNLKSLKGRIVVANMIDGRLAHIRKVLFDEVSN